MGRVGTAPSANTNPMTPRTVDCECHRIRTLRVAHNAIEPSPAKGPYVETMRAWWMMPSGTVSSGPGRPGFTDAALRSRRSGAEVVDRRGESGERGRDFGDSSGTSAMREVLARDIAFKLVPRLA